MKTIVTTSFFEFPSENVRVELLCEVSTVDGGPVEKFFTCLASEDGSRNWPKEFDNYPDAVKDFAERAATVNSNCADRGVVNRGVADYCDEFEGFQS